ncbi:MAG: hypothetical protein COU31_03015 [Candidatus Magasanikbacteria bacterium CG10_big_fil_rev_8_21_14_0_10_40_10]|uniref:Uncharacterized protein n=1 Tax=Candidatus Magasanikbacteria bacterium CG10_big_fil_rev_8_21_14_0_10_40_10 TaxID=1974648 RepID=A0A2M6W3U9_9BACT|nr:MAG: hypothetical protein COU31_03015 [Candidatus Magasanikbacteria bacterium CG10_big_fil_rev_8_21_14_0_10_40_10]
MKIFVKAKPASHKVEVKKVDEEHFVVSVKEPPAKGLANRGIIKALSDYFGVAQTDIKMVSGFSSRQKVFVIKK